MCFHDYDNAPRRRQERRRAKQATYLYNKALNMALKAALNRSKPSQQQTPQNTETPYPFTKKKSD
ncbi:MAG: hypothetical protein RAM36_04770 [Arsenophonus sp.]|nr:hypothetical protein [Arsenophonus sp.]